MLTPSWGANGPCLICHCHRSESRTPAANSNHFCRNDEGLPRLRLPAQGKGYKYGAWQGKGSLQLTML